MREEDIKEILAYCERLLQEIQVKHSESVEKKHINPVLVIEVKVVMEQCRSVLDYLAQDVYEKFIGPRTAASRIYFPYADNPAAFTNRINSNLPGLQTLSPDTYLIIEQAQMISQQRLLMWPGGGERWLVELCTITNEQKHDRLVPHEVNTGENRGLQVGNLQVNLDVVEGSGLIMTSTGAVELTDGVVTRQTGDVREIIIKWGSIRFENTTIDIVPFLQTVLYRVKVLQKRIYEELKK